MSLPWRTAVGHLSGPRGGWMRCQARGLTRRPVPLCSEARHTSATEYPQTITGAYLYRTEEGETLVQSVRPSGTGRHSVLAFDGDGHWRVEGAFFLLLYWGLS